MPDPKGKEMGKDHRAPQKSVVVTRREGMRHPRADPDRRKYLRSPRRRVDVVATSIYQEVDRIDPRKDPHCCKTLGWSGRKPKSVQTPQDLARHSRPPF